MSNNIKREEILKMLRKKRAMQRRMRMIRNSRPRFLRYLSWRFWKFGRHEYWRKPKGNDNKMRFQLKGYPPVVKIGYGSPEEIRYLHPSGLRPVIISNAKELELLDPKKHIIYVASAVGLRKRIEIVRVAQEKGFRIANAGVV